ncbi:MAG: hypothetical protein JEZ04_19200 [Spirochaetales bacterium]|nr:hypothetical protein [Spirochaetales bacterium]
MKQKNNFLTFALRVSVIQFLSYFFIGFLTFTLKIHSLGYYEQHPIEIVTVFFKHSDSLIVMAGPLFQFIRGLLFAGALYPIFHVFIEKKNDWLKLWLVIMVFAVFGPAGAAPGSIEGVIYTKLPPLFHLLYLPELVLQTALFSFLIQRWEMRDFNNKIKIILYILTGLITLMLTLGLFQTTG